MMASFRPFDHKNTPWVGKRKREGSHFHLGYFATEEEAVGAEADFDATWPSKKNQHG